MSPAFGFGASLVAQMVKNLHAMQETWVWSLDWEDSPGEGNSYPLLHFGLENSMDTGAWQATVHIVTKSWTRLSYFHSLTWTQVWHNNYQKYLLNKKVLFQDWICKVESSHQFLTSEDGKKTHVKPNYYTYS